MLSQPTRLRYRAREVRAARDLPCSTTATAPCEEGVRRGQRTALSHAPTGFARTSSATSPLHLFAFGERALESVHRPSSALLEHAPMATAAQQMPRSQQQSVAYPSYRHPGPTTRHSETGGAMPGQELQALAQEELLRETLRQQDPYHNERPLEHLSRVSPCLSIVPVSSLSRQGCALCARAHTCTHTRACAASHSPFPGQGTAMSAVKACLTTLSHSI